MNCMKAQVVDDTMHVIYAKPADRISIRTNTLDWFIQTPNLGLEYNVRKENWNRWAVGISAKGRWKGSNTFKPGIVYNLNELRVDFKNYWRERFVRGEGSHALDGNTDPHTSYFDKLFSLRRKNLYDESDPKHTYPYLKHPAIVFFRGLYGSYDKFSVKLGTTGYQGDAFSIGGTYGIIRTLHEYQRGGRLDLELGLSAGWVYLAKCTEYTLNRATNSYVKGKSHDGSIIPFPVLTELRLGCVYHFGKMQLTQQYRWRYDADSAFHALVDSIAADRQAKWEQKQIDKSYTNYIKPLKIALADARNTLYSWPDSIYSYMVLQRAIEQAEKDSTEILPPVYVNKGIVYDKDNDTKMEIIRRELEYYKGRAESYVEAERRAKFVADSIFNDSVQRVINDSISAAKRAKFVADSLLKDSVSSAKRVKFLNDSIMKDSVKRAKAALKDSLKAAKEEAKLRTDVLSDSLNAEGEESLTPEEGQEPTEGEEQNEEVTPTEQTEENAEGTEQPVNAEESNSEETNSEESNNETPENSNSENENNENEESNASNNEAQDQSSNSEEQSSESNDESGNNNSSEGGNDESNANEQSNSDEGGNDNSSNDDSTNNESSNDDSSNNETSNDDSSNNETSNDDSTNNEASNDDSTNNEASNDESSNNETSNEESTNDESKSEEE